MNQYDRENKADLSVKWEEKLKWTTVGFTYTYYNSVGLKFIVIIVLEEDPN